MAVKDKIQLRVECERAFAVIEDDTDLVEALGYIAEKLGEGIWAVVSGIGMLKEAELGVFNVEQSKYDKRVFSEPMELLALSGSLNHGDDPFYHLHAVLSGHDFGAVGGHLFKAKVHNTLELALLKTYVKGKRQGDKKLLKLD